MTVRVQRPDAGAKCFLGARLQGLDVQRANVPALYRRLRCQNQVDRLEEGGKGGVNLGPPKKRRTAGHVDERCGFCSSSGDMHR